MREKIELQFAGYRAEISRIADSTTIIRFKSPMVKSWALTALIGRFSVDRERIMYSDNDPQLYRVNGDEGLRIWKDLGGQ